jgi:membrane protease YdiL (CAAX protease family)
MLISTLALFAFYYFARADTIGTFSPARGWNAMTERPVSPVLHYIGSALLLALLPVAAVRLFGRRSLRELGLGLGRWKAGLALLVVGIPLALAAGKIGSASPVMRTVYPLDPTVTADRFLAYGVLQLLYYASWEVLFRGVVLFGLKDRIGAGPANALQTALSVLAHFGRPLTETFSALPAGLVFGGIALKVRSVWYIALIHWLVAVTVDWFLITA